MNIRGGRQMVFQTEETEGNVKVRIEGSLSIYKAVDLRNAFLACLQKDTVIECDMSGVTDCDAAGLQILFAAHKTANQMKRSLYFNEVPQVVLETLSDLGLRADKLMAVARDPEKPGQTAA
jgi:anti-sigma B factor antagonist